MRLRWRSRSIGAVLLFGVVYVATTQLDFEPRPVRLGIMVALLVAVASLIRDSLGETGPGWTVRADRPVGAPGRDTRLSGFVRLIENHLTAATPDTGLRDRLEALASERLLRSRGLQRGDPEALRLLGPDLVADLDDGTRRLSVDRIDEHLKRIEEL